MTASNAARIATLEANADIAPTMRWLSVLDNQTCVRCGARDGLEWDTKTKKPVGHDLAWQAPPLHVNCRCTTVPVTALSREIEGGRASMFGVVSGKTTFGDFLKQRDVVFQDKALGVDRAKIWRGKKLSLRDLVDASGRELTLDELRAKYSA